MDNTTNNNRSSSKWLPILIAGAVIWYLLYSYTTSTAALAIQESLQEEAQSALADHTELSQINVQADGRDIALTGSVPAIEWQNTAQDLVSSIHGVRIVKNELEIVEPVVEDEPADNGLKAKVAPIPDEFNPLDQPPTEADLALAKAQDMIKLLDLTKITFLDDLVTLAESAQTPLDTIASILMEVPTLHLFVVGYAEPGNNADTNLEVSALRAQSVVDYLIAQGIRYSRMTAQGFGDNAPSDAKPDLSTNQRIEFQLINGE